MQGMSGWGQVDGGEGGRLEKLLSRPALATKEASHGSQKSTTCFTLASLVILA